MSLSQSLLNTLSANPCSLPYIRYNAYAQLECRKQKQPIYPAIVTLSTVLLSLSCTINSRRFGTVEGHKKYVSGVNRGTDMIGRCCEPAMQRYDVSPMYFHLCSRQV